MISPSALHMCWECSGSWSEKEIPFTKWKFLCFGHSCSMTLQMAELPFVQPPGIGPKHNGITSEKRKAKIRLYYLLLWKCLCRGGKKFLKKYENSHFLLTKTKPLYAYTYSLIITNVFFWIQFTFVCMWCVFRMNEWTQMSTKLKYQKVVSVLESELFVSKNKTFRQIVFFFFLERGFTSKGS